MKKINLLPENLINQIAAGEVIERPASVVKELVENSIDAGAVKIEIEISNNCRNIRVADNGCGINKEDIALAFSRHATSKINDQKDLWSVSTLGFRGEALASIISIAKVVCISKTPDEETGTKAECENSQIKISEIGCATGTTMEISELFYNVPARLKFMKKSNTELAAVSEVVQNLALSHPGVTFNLINNKKSILKTTGSNDIAITIGEIYSKNLIDELSEVYKEDKEFKIKIEGFVSNPNFTRSNKKAIHIFINGRTIKCPIILKSIDSAYSDMIPSGRYPYVVLNLSMPQNDIDINVHPSKKEVKYANQNLIFNFVYSSIKFALSNRVNLNSSFESDEIISFEPPVLQNADSKEPVNIVSFEDRVNKNFDNIEEDDIQEVYFQKEPKQNKLDITDELGAAYSSKPGIIGQLNNTYILIQAEEGLQLVDQHIAHERYLYEKLKSEDNIASQLVLATEIIEQDKNEILIFQENIDILAKYGYELEFIADSGIKFKRVPQIVSHKSHSSLIIDIKTALESTPDNIENELLMKMACSASVKAGEKLSLGQMEELIINWQKTKYPKTCPHGRNICHTISKKEIAGFFGRVE